MLFKRLATHASSAERNKSELSNGFSNGKMDKTKLLKKTERGSANGTARLCDRTAA